MAMWIAATGRAAEAEDNPSRPPGSTAHSLQGVWRWESVKLDRVLSETLTEVSHRIAGEPWGHQGKTIWRLGYRIHSLSALSCSSGVVTHYFTCILSLYSLFYLRYIDNSKLTKNLFCFSDHHHENLSVFLKWSWDGQCLCLLTLIFNTMRLFCSSSLLFFLFSLPILSTPFLTPHCPLPHFIEDSIISILFLDLNYFVFVSLWL